MAYTRIHAIKSTVTKAVAYICNPDKTEEQLLIDTFGCGIETARHDFEYTLNRTKQSDKNQAFHLIQSFAKGGVSHEEAHRIGIELADRLLQGKFSYIVATHTDRGHPHNHIIFCAADNLSELQKQIDDKTAEAKSARTELVELEHQMKKVSELLLYAEQYRDNKPFQDKYMKSKDPDRYLRMHKTQLILYDGAERMLRKLGLDPKSVNLSEIWADYKAMQARKATLDKTYKSAEKEAKDLQEKSDNVQHFLGYKLQFQHTSKNRNIPSHS